VNGFSSSLPEEVQYKALKMVPGFENMKMFRPGYAIEYDFFPPTQLKLSLETHLVKNLFFAGQINGTTGYEEAACQGLIAGINAHLAHQDQEPFILKRSEAYIGVLIDDLVNKGTKEPYRMFTSRAEYRILLRQDNADQRLTPKAKNLGIKFLDDRYTMVSDKEKSINEIYRLIENYSVDPDQINPFLESIDSSPLKQRVKALSVLTRPMVGLDDMRKFLPDLNNALAKYPEDSLISAEVSLKYSGYIEKEQELVNRMERLESVRLRDNLDYHALVSLSAEAKEKLTRMRPTTIGQASRISGITPSDISVLLVHVGR
jgi:tRNA uridine 5-carboxymethylaminomethyl modification enzyme